MRGGSSDGTAGLKGFRRYTWWALPGATAAYVLIFSVEWVLDPRLSYAVRGVCAVAVVVTMLACAALLSRRLDLRPDDETDATPARLPLGWLCAGVAGAGVLATVGLAQGDYGLWAVAPAIVVCVGAAYAQPRRRWYLFGGALVVAAVPGPVAVLVADDGDLLYAMLFPVGMLAFVAWVTLGPLWAWDVAGRLDQARRLAAELAVQDERLRFAADLHDIQGHHLQVIALKSELAARLADADPSRAAGEMRQVQRIAVDALQDTRAVVQGYRRTTLDDELANATRVLAAADIDARTRIPAAVDTGVLAETGRHLLGLVMREATTNVLRHSRAHTAEVAYRVADGYAYLQVGNDGVDPSPAVDDGTGLRSLADRLRGAGGELTWVRDGDWFTLTARVPAGTEAP